MERGGRVQQKQLTEFLPPHSRHVKWGLSWGSGAACQQHCLWLGQAAQHACSRHAQTLFSQIGMVAVVCWGWGCVYVLSGLSRRVFLQAGFTWALRALGQCRSMERDSRLSASFWLQRAQVMSSHPCSKARGPVLGVSAALRVAGGLRLEEFVIIRTCVVVLSQY